jgi:hypothetical protein
MSPFGIFLVVCIAIAIVGGAVLWTKYGPGSGRAE